MTMSLHNGGRNRRHNKKGRKKKLEKRGKNKENWESSSSAKKDAKLREEKRGNYFNFELDSISQMEKGGDRER